MWVGWAIGGLCFLVVSFYL
ncbi:MAG: hypothetical protein ACK4OF_03835 [Aquificaceae bacterium]